MSKKAYTQSIHTATTIPLSRLTAQEGNVRKTASEAGINKPKIQNLILMVGKLVKAA